ncbi:hypothetical protein MUN82_17475 [Hymenobacter aerilatus]|uniref:Phosphatidic acid phosphatase type 2/haloperoxidase domain-containing protein n=1 Tax=Hymenobacter aerilatus TaxID=2932251 RepID=A0A8T9SSJ2_9BACT|nr:hypothetical protein [Hymenobacter aerilatus]UOR04727.1 hypothetical protein MUN82_17475 [Hymenobacter aerilatus]
MSCTFVFGFNPASVKNFLALALSVIFHPLLVPSYLYYIVCYQLPGVVLYPLLPDRWLVVGVAFGFTFLLPTLCTSGLYWAGVIDSLELYDRRQRTLPFLAAAVCFGVAAWLFLRTGFAVDALLRYMMAGMAMAVLLTLLISLRWKISAHAVGVGGAVGLLALLQLSGLADQEALWWLLGSILLAGAVLSARLQLQSHTPAQVWAGLALGISLVVGVGVGVAWPKG